jgi:hypothetical protein
MQGKADRGILVCMTGMGMTMAANKVKGIRAALATNPEEVALTRKHNDANVLAFSSALHETGRGRRDGAHLPQHRVREWRASRAPRRQNDGAGTRG